jgi:hypothetical protein
VKVTGAPAALVAFVVMLPGTTIVGGLSARHLT